MKNFLKSVLFSSLLAITATNTFAGDILKKGADEKTKISYSIERGRDKLKVTLEFGDKMQLARVVRNGFSLFIDEKGKNKQDKGLIVAGIIPQNMETPDDLRAGFFRDGTWEDGSKETLVDLFLATPPFSAVYQSDSLKSTCTVNIPIEYVSNKDIKDIKKLSIGFVSSHKKTDGNKVQGEENGSGAGFERGGQRGGGGGMRGGNMGGGMRGNRGGEMRGNNSGSMARGSIELWMEIENK